MGQQGCISPGGSRGEPASLPLLVSGGHLHALAPSNLCFNCPSCPASDPRTSRFPGKDPCDYTGLPRYPRCSGLPVCVPPKFQC